MIKRWVLHVEWHRGYRPRISIRSMIKHGQRGTDGGETGYFINCKQCSGAGTLFVPDKIPPLRNPTEMGEGSVLPPGPHIWFGELCLDCGSDVSRCPYPPTKPMPPEPFSPTVP